MNRFIISLGFVAAVNSMLIAKADETKRLDLDSNKKSNNAIGQLRPSSGSKTVLIPRLITHPVLKNLTVKDKPRTGSSVCKIFLPHAAKSHSNPIKTLNKGGGVGGDFYAGQDKGAWLEKVDNGKQPGPPKVKLNGDKIK